MDWKAYKALCDRPDVWSRWMLMQTLELLEGDAALAVPLHRALAAEPLEKPAGHKGGDATDMFRLPMEAVQAKAVAAAVSRAVERGAETSGTRGRGLGGFLEAWMEFRSFLGATEPLPIVAPDR